MLREETIEELLSIFPPVEYAFAYGSGVIKQDSYNYISCNSNSESLPMLDIILVVEDSVQWHKDNKELNPSHYTSIIPLSHKHIAFVQEALPAHFWFNAYIPLQSSKNNNQLQGRTMKYGVISKYHLTRDLTQWTNLYAAGRMHKPIQVLKDNDKINTAQMQNLENAIRTSLLLLPERFSELDLYLAIASLSYIGDPRMLVGENPKKVVNLVTPIVEHYRQLYSNPLDSLTSVAHVHREQNQPSQSDSNSSGNGASKKRSSRHDSSFTDLSSKGPESDGRSKFYFEEARSRVFVQDISLRARWDLLYGLPKAMKSLLSIKNRPEYASRKPPTVQAIRTALSTLVARSASAQTVKGLFTAGVLKGSSYLFTKMQKRFPILKGAL